MVSKMYVELQVFEARTSKTVEVGLAAGISQAILRQNCTLRIIVKIPGTTITTTMAGDTMKAYSFCIT
jgi:hypothetical protein